MLLICLSGGGDHGSYLIVGQVVAFVNLVIKHIHQCFFQRNRSGELEVPVVHVLADNDTIDTLTVLRDTIVFRVQNLPIDVVTVVLQLFDKEVESRAETRASDVFDILVNSEARFLFSEKT